MGESTQVAAGRLGPMLRVARESRGQTLGALAARSAGRFDSNRLRAFERAEVDLTSEDRLALANLYEIDLTSLSEPRVVVRVDAVDKVVRIGAAERPILTDVVGPDAVLRPYLALVRDLRSAQSGYVALRHDDIDSLAAALEVPPNTILDRIGAIMGSSPREIARTRRLFAVGAAIFVALGAAVLYDRVTSSADASEPATPSVDTAVQISPEAVQIERDDVFVPAPSDPDAVAITPEAVTIERGDPGTEAGVEADATGGDVEPG